MADFNFYINRQGIQGRKGDKGDTGFSPTISVGTDTLNEYKLIIANEVNSFETPNLRGNINVLDNGGTYLRYDAETQQISAQGLDAASSTTVGGVLMSTSSDIETMGDNTVITPANLADALPVYLQGEGAVTITQDVETSKTKINVDLSSVDELSTRVSNTEADIVGIQADITNIDADISTLNSVTANHTASISAINNNIADLNNNKVAKTDFATTETAGIVKVDGTTITSTKDGTISANLNYTLPTASTTQLGGVKVDGTTITIDGNGVISSVGGGSTGDVTSDGDNTFTGTNTFNKVVRAVNSNSVIFNDSTWKVELPDGSFIKKGTCGVNQTARHIRLEDPDGGLYPRIPVSDITLAATGDLILKANNNTIPSNITLSYVPKIKDGNGNVMLSQGNVTAGENITLEKTNDGIKISSTASGGGGATIDDNNISTTTVYSSDKTVNLATNLVDNAMITLNQTKQDTLVSGTNIKTINGQSILGEGDITISGGGGDVPIATTETVGKVKPDGTTITVTEDGTISANATAPTNMVTTNTAQTITGKKIFSNNGDHDAITFEYTGAAVRPKGFIGMNANNAGGLVSLGVDYNSRYGANSITVGSNISHGAEPSRMGVRFSPNRDGLQDCHLVMGAINYASSIGFLNSSGTITLNPRQGGHLDIGSDSLTFTKSDGTSHDLLASGGGSANITSSDSSITVTKSDTGVDIVANKDLVTGYAFPSDKYVDLTLGASGTTYTAPANGWFCFNGKDSNNTGSASFVMRNNTRYFGVAGFKEQNLSPSWLGYILPAKRGDSITYYYIGTIPLDNTNWSFRFYYAEGSQPSS